MTDQAHLHSKTEQYTHKAELGLNLEGLHESLMHDMKNTSQYQKLLTGITDLNEKDRKANSHLTKLELFSSTGSPLPDSIRPNFKDGQPLILHTYPLVVQNKIAPKPDEIVKTVLDFEASKLYPQGNDASSQTSKSPVSPESHLEAEAQTLIGNLESKVDPKQAQQATEWLLKIAQRVHSGELSRTQVSETLAQVNKLMDTKSTYLTDQERFTAATQILYHTGILRIDQGLHGTCNVTTLENIAFTKHPELAAEIITSVALNSEWTGKDGQKISVPPESLKPDVDEKLNDLKDGKDDSVPDDFFRTYASHLFQAALLNDVGQHNNSDRQEFVQKEEGIRRVFWLLGQQLLPFANYWMHDTQEVWKHSDGKETPFGGLSSGEIAAESERLFGEKYKVLVYNSPFDKISHPYDHDSNTDNGRKPDNLVTIENDKFLRETLTKMKSDDGFPAVVCVNANNRHILRESVLAAAAGWTAEMAIRPIHTMHDLVDDQLGVANHVVTIHDYDPKTDRAYISGSYGESGDGWIKLRDLWGAM